MTDWCPDLSSSNAPRYIAIADSIEADLSAGRLKSGDRLPAQRHLAKLLGLDFTTVARGYTEARRRGFLSSQVGSGTFVTDPRRDFLQQSVAAGPARECAPDFSMNLPPEPDTHDLTALMQESFARLTADLVPLLRYQNLEASDQDQTAAASWLERVGLAPQAEQILFSPGAQAALSSLLAMLANPGDQVACEAVTYPGIRSICAQLHLQLRGLDTDENGIVPEAFEAACRAGNLKVLYLNPTLHNPTTRTVPYKRRQELVAVARKFGVAILEDDAYGQLVPSAPLPFSALAPELTWYIGSLSKSLGAGLRLAYVVAPSRGASWQFSRAIRTQQVMPSPLTVALATIWIENGTASALLEEIRSESAARQVLASKRFKKLDYLADQNGFHLWLSLPQGWSRSAFVSQLRNLPIGLVEADAFTVAGAPSEAVRLGLGGPLNREQLVNALDIVSQTIEASPAKASVYF
ncbi:PLP-dependent aminotransferase family protein [Roseibium sp. HPY-6]|uniref:aminotransferase-like domain-containing protein n=1 Tax=Roseibium sp. HPY-6 TaxID=3229852 RepID=UPI00338EA352